MIEFDSIEQAIADIRAGRPVELLTMRAVKMRAISSSLQKKQHQSYLRL